MKLKLGNSLSIGRSLKQTLLIQQFFTGTGDFSGTELVDHSGNVNAKVYGRYFNATSISSYCAIRVPIPLDLTVDGLKYEFITSLAVGETQSYLTNTNAGWPYGVIIRTTGITLATKLESGSAYYFTFSTLGVTADNSFFRFKIVVSGTNLICYKTTVADQDYLSAISETLSLLVTGLKVWNEVQIGGGNLRIKSKLKLANIGGHIFTFEEGISTKSYSTTTQNSVNIGAYSADMNNYTNEICYAKDGYTTFYFKGIKISVPYSNSISNYENIIAEIKVNETLTNVAYEEYANGEFGNGYAFKLDSSILPYDSENTFFDESDNAKLMTVFEMPTRLDNRIYYNRTSNSNILLYDNSKVITSSINTVGKSALFVGDSMVSANFPAYLAYKTGLVNTVKSYSGKTTSEVLTSLQADVVTTPTLVSDKDFIFTLCGINDYFDTDEITPAQFTTAANNFLSYLRVQNSTAEIIVGLVFNAKFGDNLTGDPDLVNGGGLTYNLIRSIFTAAALTYNCVTADLSQANIIPETDTIDGLHPSVATGSLKCCNKYFDTTNAIMS